MTQIFLADRAWLTVTGKDAEDFLQGLITTDLLSLADGEARPGALLTPQGKIMFDFLVSRTEGGFRLETQAAQQDSLVKRLTMYKLRADVAIAGDATGGTTLVFDADWPENSAEDGRFKKVGFDLYRLQGDANGTSVTEAQAQYDALRIRHGIAESGADFALSDAFPHDVLLDVNGGVSFKKGCYVGQEVVSRMQHRSTARRRIVIVKAETALPATGTDLMADGKVIGTLGTVSGSQALALARIDRAGDAMTHGLPILAGHIPVTVTLPVWSGLDFPKSADEATA